MAAIVKRNGSRYAYVVITEGPGTDGDWCDSVSMSQKNVTQLIFSQSGGGVGTVVLQYKLPHNGAVWTDYVTSETLVTGVRLRLSDPAAGVKWRAGIKEDTSADPTYVSGTVIVGFDW